MFDNLTNRLQGTLKRLRGEGRLTEENMRETLREVRMALLEADVALPVVKDFIEQVRLRAQGQEVLSSLTPGQALIKVVQEELVGLMGAPEPLQVAPPPAVILVAGLQGAGKTTTVGKLARFIVDRHKKSVLVASTDVYRPAAIDQLKRLATQVGVEFFPSDPQDKPVEIAAGAVNEARRRVIDVVLVDSAGRLHIDGEMMDEIRAVHEAIHPVETLFVVDSMTGQDAVNTAKAFNEALPLSGVILTKTDGDARGGAALSLRKVTGKPIKFLGVGEGMQALEAFDAQRVASRILGMGDVVALVEQAYQAADQEKSQALAKKIAKGKGFDLDDFREQLRQMEKMGGLASVVDKLPGMGEVPEHVRAQMNDKQTARLIAIINSMTPGERRNPDMIRGSRKRRIASGSGTQVQEVNRLLKQYEDMQRMMKSFGKGGLGRMLQGMKGKLPGIPR
ncbi:MAG: signal recognition particle [Acidithiobacillales bacterium SM23_46]|nr:MAG: signal recognition particle [Acidithiobacillales bacterium SM23_46]